MRTENMVSFQTDIYNFEQRTSFKVLPSSKDTSMAKITPKLGFFSWPI